MNVVLGSKDTCTSLILTVPWVHTMVNVEEKKESEKIRQKIYGDFSISLLFASFSGGKERKKKDSRRRFSYQIWNFDFFFPFKGDVFAGPFVKWP